MAKILRTSFMDGPLFTIDKRYILLSYVRRRLHVRVNEMCISIIVKFWRARPAAEGWYQYLQGEIERLTLLFKIQS